jgi:hypothetical protein
MPLIVGGILGGISLGGSLLSGFGASSQAQAQAMQQQLIAQNANFQRQWQIQANNRNIEKANLAKAINNKAIEQTALSERAIQEVYTELGYDNAKGQFSKQTNQVNSALLSSVSGRNISASSGTARALLRQNLENATVNMANLRINRMNKMRDIQTTYQNKLAQRDFNYQELQVYLPGYSGMVEANNTGQILASGALSGLQAGITGALLYGQGSGGGGGVESYTTPGGSNFVGPIKG